MFIPEGSKHIEIVDFDYDAPGVPESVKILKPLMYKEREEDHGTACEGFCVCSGISPAEGIVGCGMCLDEAIDDWRKELRERAGHPQEDDKVAQQASKELSNVDCKTW